MRLSGNWGFLVIFPTAGVVFLPHKAFHHIPRRAHHLPTTQKCSQETPQSLHMRI